MVMGDRFCEYSGFYHAIKNYFHKIAAGNGNRFWIRITILALEVQRWSHKRSFPTVFVSQGMTF
jgi:hypothetical protein